MKPEKPALLYHTGVQEHQRTVFTGAEQEHGEPEQRFFSRAPCHGSKSKDITGASMTRYVQMIRE